MIQLAHIVPIGLNRWLMKLPLEVDVRLLKPYERVADGVYEMRR
jgi:hypothetical protein